MSCHRCHNLVLSQHIKKAEGLSTTQNSYLAMIRLILLKKVHALFPRHITPIHRPAPQTVPLAGPIYSRRRLRRALLPTRFLGVVPIAAATTAFSSCLPRTDSKPASVHRFGHAAQGPTPEQGAKTQDAREVRQRILRADRCVRCTQRGNWARVRRRMQRSSIS